MSQDDIVVIIGQMLKKYFNDKNALIHTKKQTKITTTITTKITTILFRKRSRNISKT